MPKWISIAKSGRLLMGQNEKNQPGRYGRKVGRARLKHNGRSDSGRNPGHQIQHWLALSLF